MITPALINIFGETIISFYPILIKLTTLDVPFNTFIRLTSYLLISSLFTNYNIIGKIGFGKLLALAITNIIHILSSYYGFKALVPSLAESIFYIYPFLILLLNGLVLQESINYNKMWFLLPIIYSIYHIYQITESDPNKISSSDEISISKGIIMIIIAVITESLLYILIKTTQLGSNPWNTLFVSYALGAIIYAVYYIWSIGIDNLKELVNENKQQVIWLIIANMIIGTLGYGLRFWSIPRVPSLLFTAISYTGIIATVFYSFILQIEMFSLQKIGYLALLVFSLLTMLIT